MVIDSSRVGARCVACQKRRRNIFYGHVERKDESLCFIACKSSVYICAVTVINELYQALGPKNYEKIRHQNYGIVFREIHEQGRRSRTIASIRRERQAVRTFRQKLIGKTRWQMLRTRQMDERKDQFRKASAAIYSPRI